MKSSESKARAAPRTYRAEQVRQGEIIVRTRLRRSLQDWSVS
jgi:hypothetical protein